LIPLPLFSDWEGQNDVGDLRFNNKIRSKKKQQALYVLVSLHFVLKISAASFVNAPDAKLAVKKI
jgi:hypothetical protein